MGHRYRVAMIAACPLPAPRGTPVRVWRMAEALARRGHELHIITYHLGETRIDPRFCVHRIGDVPTYRRVAPGPSLQKLLVVDPLLALKVRRVLRDHDVDVIHAHHYEGLIIADWARRDRVCPVVYDAHTLLASELPNYKFPVPRGVMTSIGGCLDRRVPALADHIVTVTDDIRQAFIDSKVAKPEAVTTIGNGIELEAFDASRRRSQPDPTDRLTLAFAGNLALYQGIDLMLRAFREILRRQPRAELLIISDSPFDPYEQMARELGVRERVRLVQSDFDALPAWLARADILLNPRPHCHGFPQKLLNYMAAGKPIVSFAGSGKGLVHRETAWLLDDGDVAGFADAAVRLLNDAPLAATLGERARGYVTQRCSWDRTAELVEQAYDQLLVEQRAHGLEGSGFRKSRKCT
jgi:glycosyltransferase involved in cell wall biosynthesis